MTITLDTKLAELTLRDILPITSNHACKCFANDLLIASSIILIPFCVYRVYDSFYRKRYY